MSGCHACHAEKYYYCNRFVDIRSEPYDSPTAIMYSGFNKNSTDDCMVSAWRCCSVTDTCQFFDYIESCLSVISEVTHRRP